MTAESLVRTTWLVAIIWWTQLSVFAQDEVIDSDAVNVVETWVEQSGNLADAAQYDSAVVLAEKAVRYAQNLDLLQREAEGYYALGYAYDLNGRLDEALLNYEHARQIYDRLDIKQEVATCMNSKGVAAYFMGDFELALKHYLETLSYVEKHDIRTVMANTLNNLGVIYRITSKNDEAISIYHKTLKLSKELQDTNMIATSYQNLGVAHNFKGLTDTALIYLDSALYVYGLAKDTFQMGHVYTAMGETYYLSESDYAQARKYLLQGAEYMKGESNQEELSKTFHLLGRIERDDHQYEKALQYFHDGLDMVSSTDRSDVLLTFYQDMEICYDQLGRYKEAHDYLQKYISLYKEIQSAERQQAIEELQTRYETEEKDKEIAMQKLQILEGNRQRNLLIGVLLAVLLTASFVFLLVRRKHQFDQELALQEKKLKEEKIKKLEQEKKIIAMDHMLEGEEKERKRIAKDLHDSLGSLLTSARIQLNRVAEDMGTLQKEVGWIKAQDIVSEAADEVRRISHDMMPEALVNLGLISAIEDLTASMSSNQDLLITTHFFDVDEGLLSGQQQSGVYRVIQELLQNTMKHASASELIVQLSQNDSSLDILVEDNGVGFNPESLTETSGIGLRNMESRVSYLDGEMHIQSNPGGPTIAEFSIPL